MRQSPEPTPEQTPELTREQTPEQTLGQTPEQTLDSIEAISGTVFRQTFYRHMAHKLLQRGALPYRPPAVARHAVQNASSRETRP